MGDCRNNGVMRKNPCTFPVCSSYETTSNTSEVVLLASKSWDNLEAEAPRALQEIRRRKCKLGKTGPLGKGGVLGKTGSVSLSEALGVTCGAHELPWVRHSHLCPMAATLGRPEEHFLGSKEQQLKAIKHSTPVLCAIVPSLKSWEGLCVTCNENSSSWALGSVRKNLWHKISLGKEKERWMTTGDNFFPLFLKTTIAHSLLQELENCFILFPDSSCCKMQLSRMPF